MSYTTTSTFTRTHAAYLASKIAADLHQLQSFYGSPTEAQIATLVEEATILIAGGYLGSIDYGFIKSDRSWALMVHYEVNEKTGVLDDHNSGRIPVGILLGGATWYSILTYSQKFHALPTAEQERIEATLPTQRGTATAPSMGLVGSFDKTYSSNGVEVRRQIFKP